MDATFKFYSQILNNMIKTKNFWRYYFLSPYNMDYGKQIDNDTWFFCGVTRGCIASDECDEVIKFNFDNGNECYNENKIYAAASTVGLDKYFVPCRFLGNYECDVNVMSWDDAGKQTEYSEDPEDWDNIVEDEEEMCVYHICIPLYAYTRVDKDFECNELSPAEHNFCRDAHSPLTERSYKVGVEFLREYGEEVFYNLSSFCEEWEVNDLHSGNVGYLDGHIVILDYAGY